MPGFTDPLVSGGTPIGPGGIPPADRVETFTFNSTLSDGTDTANVTITGDASDSSDSNRGFNDITSVSNWDIGQYYAQFTDDLAADLDIAFTDSLGNPMGVDGFTFAIGNITQDIFHFDRITVRAYDVDNNELTVSANLFAVLTGQSNTGSGVALAPTSTSLPGGGLQVDGGVPTFGFAASQDPDVGVAVFSFSGAVARVEIEHIAQTPDFGSSPVSGYVSFGAFNGTDVIPNAVCLEANTQVMCVKGEKPVGEIQPGDLVITKDGPKPVRWVGRVKVAPEELAANDKLHPVRIMADALGPNIPKRDLWVTRQHRMLVSANVAKRLTGSAEVLVAAIKLTKLPGVVVDDSLTEVEYVHLLLDEHHIMYAEGAETETLYLGPVSLSAMSDAAKTEVLSLFPELADENYTMEPAYPIPENEHQRKIVSQFRRKLQ